MVQIINMLRYDRRMKKINITAEEIIMVGRMPLSLRGTWITWKLGFNPYFMMSRETFYRHWAELKDNYGIDIKSTAGE